MKAMVRELYYGATQRAVAFRYGMLVFDLLTIGFVVATSFLDAHPTVVVLDVLVGLVILADFSARLWIAHDRRAHLLHPLGLADLVVIFALLAPLVADGLAFLRVVRMLRLLRSWQTVRRLREDFDFFRRNQQTIDAAINLFVFVFVTTAIVYETQHRTNPKIADYADALYFTVTTLTTTGFGDVTLEGTGGRMLSVAIMIFGVSLFIRLAQVVVRPAKVEHKCPTCGLRRHDADAVHCKACGRILCIEDDGAD